MGNCNCKSSSNQDEKNNQIHSALHTKSYKAISVNNIPNYTTKDQLNLTTVKDSVQKRKPKAVMLLQQDDSDVKDNVKVDEDINIKPDDAEEIKKTLKGHFIFSQLQEKEVQFAIKNMRYCKAEQDEYIFKQGDVAGSYYIILEGSCIVEINNQKKKILNFGDSFGDLGIVYRAPRSASVKAITHCQLVEMGRKAFNKMMEQINLMNESQNKLFLKVLSFFENLTEQQKNAIASACITQTYEEGNVIFNQGDDANSIYIIKKGIVLIKEKNIQLKEKQSFGEACLFDDKSTKPIRSHTLIAKTHLQVISISRQTFSNIFGDNLKNTLKKNLIYKIIKESPIYKNDNLWLQNVNKAVLTPFKAQEIVIRKGISCQQYIYIILNSPCESLEKKYQANSILQIGEMNQKLFIFKEDIKALNDGYIAKIEKVKLTKQFSSSSKSENIQENIELDDFYVVKSLRSGNFGKVVAGFNKKTQKLYAIKILQRKSIEQQQLMHYVMNQEEILRTAPQHPFLVKFNKLFKDQSFIYLVMQLIEGEDLFDAMSKICPLEQAQVQFYASQILLVLQHLHNHRIIYRDLKPQNIMVRRNGYLTLVDLGTSKKLRIEKRFKTKTIIGTPHYIAPEIISGKGYSFPVDLWSLGVVIYQLSCNRLPFGQSSEDPFCIYQQIIGRTLKYPRNCQRNVRVLIERLLSKNPLFRQGNGFQQLKRYQLFNSLNWEELLQKKIKPVYLPPLSTQINTQQIKKAMKQQANKIQTFCIYQKEQQQDFD